MESVGCLQTSTLFVVLFDHFLLVLIVALNSNNLFPLIHFQNVNMWPSTGKPSTTRHPSRKNFLHLQSCRRPDIELSKFYLRSLSRSHYNRPNRSLPSAWNNTFLRNQSIFSRYLRTPRCARFSCRRSHMVMCVTINNTSPCTDF